VEVVSEVRLASLPGFSRGRTIYTGWRWCSGQVGSVVAVLQGRRPDGTVVFAVDEPGKLDL
jgi:hypothetical protein